MFTVYCISGFDKSASIQPSREVCERMMKEIYEEQPDYWPHGLGIEGHTDVFMIRSASTGEPVGFTGWQEFHQPNPATGAMEKVGMYSIGILKRFRNNGFAKAAVTQLIQRKAAGVDRLAAYIMPHNHPSLGLAERLGVQSFHR